MEPQNIYYDVTCSYYAIVVNRRSIYPIAHELISNDDSSINPHELP